MTQKSPKTASSNNSAYISRKSLADGKALIEEARELKAPIDLREFVKQYWGNGKPGRNYATYYSPLRNNDKNPSFKVYADKYYDFGTGAWGDLFDVIGNVYRLESLAKQVQYFKQNINGERISNTRRQLKHHPLPRHSEDQPQTADWHNLIQTITCKAEKYLWSGENDAEKVLSYLTHERGLSDETIRRFHLGYNPQLYPAASKGQKIWVAPGILIPWWAKGTLTAVRVRCRVGSFAKYLGCVDISA